MEDPLLTAQCDCGALKVVVSAHPAVQLVCHCHECQAFFERPYVEAMFFPKTACEVHGAVASKSLQGGSGFDKAHCACARCLTPLFVTVSALNNAIAIPAERLGTLKFDPAVHIWTSQSAEAAAIPEGVLQSPDGPPQEVRDLMVAAFWGEP